MSLTGFVRYFILIAEITGVFVLLGNPSASPAAPAAKNGIPSEQVVALMVQGAHHLEQNQPASALDVLQQASRDSSAPAGVFRLMAFAYLEEKKTSDAVKMARKALELTPGRTEAHADAELLLARTSYQDYLAQYAVLLQRARNLPAFAQLLASMSTVIPSSDPTRHPATELPGDATAPYEYADAVQQIQIAIQNLRDLLDQSEASAKAALEYDNNLGGAHDTLGLVYTSRGSLHEARQEFEAEIASSGLTAYVVEHQGELYIQSQDYMDAVAALKSAVAMQPNRISAYEALALVYERLHDQDSMHSARAMSRLYSNKLSDAQNELGHLPKSSVDYLFGSAVLALVRQDSAAARALVGQALTARPNDLPSLLLLASLQYKARDLAGAAATYKKALEIDPKCDAAWFGQGLLLDDQNQLNAAIDAYRQALRYNAGNSAALINLAVDQADLRQTKDAVDSLRGFLNKFPTDRSCLEVQGALEQIEANSTASG